MRGRTVIPGLIDSHLHAIRAALSFSTEVNWIGARSLEEALGRIRAAARTMKPGSWLIVAGGWNVQQFEENRRPTQAELTAVAPNNPVYVQLGYGWSMLTPLAHKALGSPSDADLPSGGRFERDGSGALTGAVTGAQNAIVALFDRLPKPTFAEQVEGTKAFFRELNRLAMTGAGDPGGNNLTSTDYQALFKVWRDKAMTVRVAYTLNGQTPGKEFEELRDLTGLLPMGFGDDMLRFNGLGERITVAMNNNNAPSQADKDAYYRIVKWAAERGMSLTMHWGSDASVDHLLSIFERVNCGDSDCAAALVDCAFERCLRCQPPPDESAWRRLDDAGRDVFRGRAVPETGRAGCGDGARRRSRPRGRWASSSAPARMPIAWLRTIRSRRCSGCSIRRPSAVSSMRGPEEIPSRIDALRFYTLGSAWFSFDEDERGSLEVGKLADLAVLSDDYMTVPVEKIGGLESVLTMVGGKVVYAAGPFAEARTRSPSDMDLQLKNKVAIVTGASKGIGRAIAQTLAEEGMRLVVVARSRASTRRTGLTAGRCVPRAGGRSDESRCPGGDCCRDDGEVRAYRRPRQQRGLDEARRLPYAVRRGLGRWLRTEVLRRHAIQPRRLAASLARPAPSSTSSASAGAPVRPSSRLAARSTQRCST